MRSALLFLLFSAVSPAALISDVRALIAKDDFTGAQKLIADFRKQNGPTAEAIAAQSWLGRGALAAKRYEQALEYAAETREACLETLKKRALDEELEFLPIALGASIEVNGQALAGLGRRSEAISFLKEEMERWHKTSMRARIQKNLHILSLAGTAPPELERREFLGPKPPALASLKGKAVLMFFWAHWCGDCKYQGPILAQLRDKYASRGLVLLAPTSYYGYAVRGEDATPAQEKAHISQVRKQHYPGLDSVPAPLSTENHKTYGVSTTPTLVLVDRSGLVRMYHPGRMTYEELAAELEKVL